MSLRSDVFRAARWYNQFTPFKATPDDLIYFFEEAGCKEIPTRAQANDAMTRSYGIYMGGKKPKHWCGIFCCAVLREAGVAVSWDLENGTMTRQTLAVKKVWCGGKPARSMGIQPGDVAIIPAADHHFLIMSIDDVKSEYTTLEGNTLNQYIRTVTRPYEPANSSQSIVAFWKIGD